MAFTQVAVSGSYQTADGQPASGTVTFTLTQPMTNGGQIVEPSPLEAVLDGTGSFTITLFANDDAATSPQGVVYGVTEQVTDGQPRDFFVAVPSADAAVNLADLMPGEPGWE